MTFDAIGIAGTSMNVNRKWLDAIADNIANANTAKPTDGEAFRARYITATEGEGLSGVYVSGAAFGDAEGRMTYQPDHELADENGYIRLPDIDLGEQMSSLIIAQRAYQASAAVVDRAKVSYEAALQIGKN